VATASRSVWPVLAAAIAVVASAAAGGYLSAHLATRDLRQELAMRPPIVVLDLATLAQGRDATAVGETLARGLNAAQRLAAGGVLVLDSQAVIADPPDLRLDLRKIAPP
jgi:hypothetical protein